MANFGVPYQGSKNNIARDLINQLPSADYFVDIFAGGCAMTHAAMVSGKYKHFIANDLDGRGVELFKRAINGEYKNETRWISREDFHKLKDSDPYVSICWNFGGKLDGTYLYGEEIAPYKRALHYVVMFDEWEEFDKLCPEVCDIAKQHLKRFTSTKNRRIEIGRVIVSKLKDMNDWSVVENNPLYKSAHWRGGFNDVKQNQDLQGLQSLESLERLERLQSLERLERLESLERLQSLERLPYLTTSKLDYKSVEIPPNSVIYCDPPYKNTAGYRGEFDPNEFYTWALAQKQPVFISELTAPSAFECVWKKPISNRLNGKGSDGQRTECLFTNKAGYKAWKSEFMNGRLFDPGI